MATLLERAKAAKAGKKPISTVFKPDEFELAAAFVDGEVSVKQISEVIGVNRTNVYHWVGARLIAAYRAGKLVRVNE